MFVSPWMDPDYVRQEVQRLNVAGLKCYHSESPNKPTWNAEIPEFLPEELVRVAHELRICITLHMVKQRSVADPSNQHWIRTYCERYPNMKLILAHAARSFNPVWAMEGIESLKGLPNLYCDTSAIGEVGACEAIIQHLGHDRLVWGTDFPITHMRGNYVAVGNGHIWVGPESHPDSDGAVHSGFVHNGLEQLRVVKQAAWHQRLTDSQVEDVFFNNLAGLIDIHP
jgi:glutamate-1-semialdehyde 2,1-aminomutase